MTNPAQKNLSPFAHSALTLDEDFGELDRVAAQLERLDLDTENGLDQARKLLVRFTECGNRIGEGVQALAKALDEARTRAEKSAESVSQRAAMVQARQQEAQKLVDRFTQLAETVRKVTAAVGELQKSAEGGLAEEGRALLIKNLTGIDAQLDTLSNEAGKLRADAREARQKTLEKNADALEQSLQSVRRKLSALVGNGPQQRPAELH
jgi:hypothetical protein